MQTMNLPARQTRRSELPAKLKAQIGHAAAMNFDRLSLPSRLLFRRGLVHFAQWLKTKEAVVLDPEPDSRTPARVAWEDHACTEAGNYFLRGGFEYFEAVHLVEAYLTDCLFEEPRLSRATVRTRLAALRWATREAQRQNLVKWDLSGAKMPKARKDKHGRLIEKRGRDMRGPEPEEKRRLLEVAAEDPDPRVFVTLSMCLREGYREHEIRQIDVEDFDLKHKLVWLVRKKKTEPSKYPLTSGTLAAVQRWLADRGKSEGPFLYGGRYGHIDEDRLGQSTIFRWVNECCTAAGVKPMSPHRLRHRACTDIVNECARQGKAIQVAMYLTDHKNESTLNIYYDRAKDLLDARAILESA